VINHVDHTHLCKSL